MLLLKYARQLSGVFLLFLLAACATAPQTLRLNENPPDSIASSAELVEVPFFPQQAYQCGPASLATILNHQGIDVEPNQLVDRVYIPERQGSLQVEMVATARNYGLLSYKIAPQLEAILKEIDHGNAVLVFQNLALDIFPKWHYAVVVGYDLDKSELILRSGTNNRYVISFSTFEKTWSRANHWAYVFTKVGNIPNTAQAVDYIKASFDLQKSQGFGFSIAAFRAGAKKWPENSLMLMTLANVEYDAGNWQQAIHRLRTEIKLRPYNKMAWNNLAYALVANDCKQQAIMATQCASLIAPDDENIRQSLAEITQISAGNTGSCKEIQCPIESH